MSFSHKILRDHARTIWQVGVDAVAPDRLIQNAFRIGRGKLVAGSTTVPLRDVARIAVVGAGKAGAAMSQAIERILGDRIAHAKQLFGCVNVPDRTRIPLKYITLHGARSAPDNKPTEAGVAGSRRMRSIVESLGPRDLAICLLSGGGSALLPAPVPSITLGEKQTVTSLLHGCGASIGELNAVRKHLSELKGGGLARQFHGGWLISLVISDVVGDPLDVIASGPTASDTSTFTDAVDVLKRYELWDRTPESIRIHLSKGMAGECPETLKRLPRNVSNLVIGNNATALDAAASAARRLGYRVVNLSSFLEGDSRQLGIIFAGLVRGIQSQGKPLRPPVCILSGGETTVSLGPDHGLGGRNQELVLAAFNFLQRFGLDRVVVLSGGTDGEDGPTDAAGAIADSKTAATVKRLQIDPAKFLDRHNSYHFFEATGDLIKTGLTNTNVMDLRVVLVGS